MVESIDESYGCPHSFGTTTKLVRFGRVWEYGAKSTRKEWYKK